MAHQELWNRVHSTLQQNMDPRLYQTWIKGITLESVDDSESGKVLGIGVPGSMYKEWILENAMVALEKAVATELPPPFQFNFIVSQNYTQQELTPIVAKPVTPQDFPENNMPKQEEPTSRGPKLNPEYTFRNFVVGQSNELAHAACHSVSEKPGKTVNPLFVCGPSGTGKTHLLNSVGIAIREKFPEKRICYISGERFINDVITSIRHKQMDRFHHRYRQSYDVLIMDDIHVIARTQSTQHEFFETFNYFHGAGKQVVVASDLLPKQMDGLEDRIRTRLEWGMIVDIEPPDLETRVAILRYKAERQGIFVPDDVVHLVSQISTKSVRELEGNLNTIRMYSELRGVPITMELAKDVFKSTLQQQKNGPTLEDVMKIVAERYNTTIRDLKSSSRAKPIAKPRQIAMYLARRGLRLGYIEIGRGFGNRDHTTIMHGERKVAGEMDLDMDFKNEIKKLENIINNSQWNIL